MAQVNVWLWQLARLHPATQGFVCHITETGAQIAPPDYAVFTHSSSPSSAQFHHRISYFSPQRSSFRMRG
jgi:hypothetical protein